MLVVNVALPADITLERSKLFAFTLWITIAFKFSFKFGVVLDGVGVKVMLPVEVVLDELPDEFEIVGVGIPLGVAGGDKLSGVGVGVSIPVTVGAGVTVDVSVGAGVTV